MTSEAIENQKKVAEINRRYMADEITREEAIELLTPIGNEINAKAKQIAKKYGMAPRYVKIKVSKSYGAELN